MNELLMFDTAQSDYGSVPTDAQAIAPYMDRRYNNLASARARFPHLFNEGRVLTLTAGGGDADGIDWEPGNAEPPGWYEQQKGRGRWRPCFYADLSDMRGTVIPMLESHIGHLPAAGPGRPVRIFTAHPTGTRHLCGPTTCGFPWEADASQYWWTSLQGRFPGANGDVDVSTVREDFFKSSHPTPKPDPYAIFIAGKFPIHEGNRVVLLNERQTVQTWDWATTHHPNSHRALIALLHSRLVFLRKWVWFRAHENLGSRQPTWGMFNRGVRWKELLRRTDLTAFHKMFPKG